MPSLAEEKSALAVRRLSRPGSHAVGGVAGLYLRIADTGAKYWVWRGTVGGRRREAGIGPYPEISLARAREKAAEMREAARNGVDPIAEKQAARDALRAATAARATFNDCMSAYLDQKAREFKNQKHAKQWRTSVEKYAGPVIGTMPVDRIKLSHVVDTLRPIWNQVPETASRVRGRIEKVLDFATVSGYRKGENPARWKGNLDAVLPAPSKIRKVQHHRAIDWQEAPAFLAALRKRKGIAARALEFLLLTGTRSGEVRGATWNEIDMETGVWTIPGTRMKAGNSHTVPLSEDALAILRSAPILEGSSYIFPAARGGMLSDMSLSAVMRRMEVNATPHGLRSTFRDWISESTSYPHEVAEQALAHVIPSAVERAYRRGDLLDKRVRLMADWATFLS